VPEGAARTCVGIESVTSAPPVRRYSRRSRTTPLPSRRPGSTGGLPLGPNHLSHAGGLGVGLHRGGFDIDLAQGVVGPIRT
jgi:hypothetical protein